MGTLMMHDVDVHARGIASYPNIPPFHTNFKLTDDLSSLEEFEDTIGAIRIRIFLSFLYNSW
jgi:hypothetical protein